ncbi:MAG: sigma-70 family RNA polymerase sigma factor [Clostridia bacterium]|nr:sigma-70 family RNA polymerase sigma factor [Clostridia bacterium]
MDRDERNALVEQNIGLVHSCANKFRSRGVEYDDLFQAGCVGLIKAAENFDPDRGFSFSTYAVPVILGEIKRIFRDGGSVKVGRALKEKARAAMREKEKLTLELGQEPTITELADRLGLDVAQTAQLMNVAMPTVSLTASDDDGGGQIDVPVDSPEMITSDLIALREVISMLDDRDREMIKLRYYSGFTQSRTAEVLGMSQVQVSRREKAVLALLRRNLSA